MNAFNLFRYVISTPITIYTVYFRLSLIMLSHLNLLYYLYSQTKHLAVI